MHLLDLFNDHPAVRDRRAMASAVLLFKSTLSCVVLGCAFDDSVPVMDAGPGEDPAYESGV